MSPIHDPAPGTVAHPQRVALPSSRRAPTATTIVLITIVLALLAFIAYFE